MRARQGRSAGRTAAGERRQRAEGRESKRAWRRPRGHATACRNTSGGPRRSTSRSSSFQQIGRELGISAIDAELEGARRVGMNGASVLLGTFSGDCDDDASLRTILSHPLCIIATNAAATRTGPQNPSATGAFPHVLGRYVRELGLLSHEAAVQRMTSHPAARLGLEDTGRIAEGYWADLTVFDPVQISDAAEPERADAVPLGIRMVLVSGIPVVEDGIVKQAVPGRVLRRHAH